MAVSHGIVLHVTFVDLCKAYGNILLSEYWPVMHRAGFSGAYITAVRNFYDG